MHCAPPRPRRLPAGPLGLLPVLTALLMQLAAVGTVPMSGAAAQVDRLLAISICHAPAPDQGNAPVHRHAPDCALCPFCQAIAHAGVLLAAPVFGFLVPLLRPGRLFALAAARAPPGRVTLAALARGPPAAF